MKAQRPIFLTALALMLGTGLSVKAAFPQPNDVQLVLGQVADDIATSMKKDFKRQRVVTLRPFHPVKPKGKKEKAWPASFGPRIASALSSELAKRKIRISTKKSRLILTGEYEAVDDTSSGITGVLLTVHLSEKKPPKSKKPVKKKTFQAAFIGDENVAHIFGLTLTLPTRGTPKERNNQVKRALDKPVVHLEDNPKAKVKKSLVTTGKKADYAIEILIKDKKKYQPQSARAEKGLAYVDIARTQVYAVRLINRSKYEAAVKLTLDGLSMFTFSKLRHKNGPKKGEPQLTYILVPPKSDSLITGWHLDNKQSLEFKVTEYGKGALAKLGIGNSENVGTITASFGAAWKLGEKRPPDEMQGQSRSANATGFGEKIKKTYKIVPRVIGAVRATISVRYNRGKQAQ